MFIDKNRYIDFYQYYIQGFTKVPIINEISILKTNLYFPIINKFRSINKLLEEYKDRFSNARKNFIFSLNKKYYSYSKLLFENFSYIIPKNMKHFNKNKFNKWENMIDLIIPNIFSFKTIFIFEKNHILSLKLPKSQSLKFRNVLIFDKFNCKYTIIKQNDFFNAHIKKDFVLLAEKLLRKTKDTRAQTHEDGKRIKDLLIPKSRLNNKNKSKLRSPFGSFKNSGNSRLSMEATHSYYLSLIPPPSKNSFKIENDQEMLKTERERSRSECPAPKNDIKILSLARSKTPDYRDHKENRQKDFTTPRSFLKRVFGLKAKSFSNLPTLTESIDISSKSPVLGQKSHNFQKTNIQTSDTLTKTKESTQWFDFTKLPHKSPRLIKRKAKNAQKYEIEQSNLEHASTPSLDKLSFPPFGHGEYYRQRNVSDAACLRKSKNHTNLISSNLWRSMPKLPTKSPLPFRRNNMKSQDIISNAPLNIESRTENEPKNNEQKLEITPQDMEQKIESIHQNIGHKTEQIPQNIEPKLEKKPDSIEQQISYKIPSNPQIENVCRRKMKEQCPTPIELQVDDVCSKCFFNKVQENRYLAFLK